MHVAKAQQKLKLAKNVEDNKERFLNMSVSKSSPKITSACYRMRTWSPHKQGHKQDREV